VDPFVAVLFVRTLMLDCLLNLQLDVIRVFVDGFL
jgi:hypothetical protein